MKIFFYISLSRFFVLLLYLPLEIKPWYNYTGRPYNEDYKNTSSLSEHLNFEQHLTDRKILPGSRIRQKDGRFIEPKYDIGNIK